MANLFLGAIFGAILMSFISDREVRRVEKENDELRLEMDKLFNRLQGLIEQVDKNREEILDYLKRNEK